MNLRKKYTRLFATASGPDYIDRAFAELLASRVGERAALRMVADWYLQSGRRTEAERFAELRGRPPTLVRMRGSTIIDGVSCTIADVRTAARPGFQELSSAAGAWRLAASLLEQTPARPRASFGRTFPIKPSNISLFSPYRQYCPEVPRGSISLELENVNNFRGTIENRGQNRRNSHQLSWRFSRTFVASECARHWFTRRADDATRSAIQVLAAKHGEIDSPLVEPVLRSCLQLQTDTKTIRCATSRALALMQLAVVVQMSGSVVRADDAVPLFEDALNILSAFAGCEAIDAARRKVLADIRRGVEHGWFPEAGPIVPTPTQSEVDSFLIDGRALLIAGPFMRLGLAWRNGQGAVEIRRFSISDNLAIAFKTFGEARAKFCNPPRMTLPGGKFVQGNDLENLSDSEQRVALPGPTTEAERADLSRALTQLFEAFADTRRELATHLRQHGLRSVGIVGRMPLEDAPWGPLITEGAGAEDVSFVHLDSLARIPGWDFVHTEQLMYAGGRAGGSREIDLGRAALGASGPLNRVELEDMKAGRIAIFAHGTYIVGVPQASGIVLDTSPRELEARWQTTEIRSIDLRGCARTELWAFATY